MGLHYVNDALVGNGIVDVTHPQIVLYEALPNGKLKLTGADYLVLAEAWKENPKGAFVNWHPNVSCQSFVGKTPH